MFGTAALHSRTSISVCCLKMYDADTHTGHGPPSHFLYRNKINPRYSSSHFAIFNCSASQILITIIHYPPQIPATATPHPTKTSHPGLVRNFYSPTIFPILK
jgi:hypothetical protein